MMIKQNSSKIKIAKPMIAGSIDGLDSLVIWLDYIDCVHMSVAFVLLPFIRYTVVTV